MFDAFVKSNTAAVAVLQQGDHDQAVLLLCQALKSIRDCRIGSSSSSRKNQDSASSGICQAERSRQGADKNNRAIHCFESTDDVRMTSPGGFFFLYSNAFSIQGVPTTTLSHRDQQVLQNMLTSILLFNMALSFHRKGLFTATHSTKNLKRALRLYSMIREMHGDEGKLQELPVLVQLALWNNIGHIHSHFFERKAAFHCQTRLAQGIANALRQRSFSTDDYNFFQRSTLYSNGDQGFHVAPAA